MPDGLSIVGTILVQVAVRPSRCGARFHGSRSDTRRVCARSEGPRSRGERSSCARRPDRECFDGAAAASRARPAGGWCRYRRTAVRTRVAGWFPAASASPAPPGQAVGVGALNSRNRSCRPCASRRSRARARRSGSDRPGAAPRSGRRRSRSGCLRRRSFAGGRRSGTTRRRGRGRRDHRRARCHSSATGRKSPSCPDAAPRAASARA